jgi:flagellar hook-length control protein FliK
MDRSTTGEKTSQNMSPGDDNSFPDVRIDQPAPTLVSTDTPRGNLPAGLIQEHIPSPVGTNKWGNDVGQKVVWLINNDESSATLTLNPPDLGPMKVVVHVENGQAHASFSADQPEVRQALLDSIPKLREVMENAGISLGQTNVSQSNSGSQDTNGGDNKRKFGSITSIDSDSNEDASLNTSVTTIARRGLVDTFA